MSNETLQGLVSRVIYRNPENGYCVLAVTPNSRPEVTPDPDDDFPMPADDSSIKAVGNIPGIREGDEYRFSGKWTNHDRFGRQFKIDDAEVILPDNRGGVIAYLCSDHFYGIGPVAASKVVDALGEDALDKLKSNPDAAYSIPGLSGGQADELARKMRSHSALGELITMICGDGVSTNLAAKINSKYGDEAIDQIKNNPYQLIKDLPGVGFKIADRIARVVGVAPNSPYRVEAAIRHVLSEAEHEGHVALPAGEINRLVMELLGPTCGVEPRDVGKIGMGMVASQELEREKDHNLVYKIGLHRAEVLLAMKLRYLSTMRADSDDPGIVEQLVEFAAGRQGIDYAPEQREAIITAIVSNISIITGGPGTGKSTITNAIVDVYRELNPRGHNIYLASPTGRAAKRLAEVTGHEATTIHRLLHFHPYQGFQFDENEPLPGPGLLIVDEGCFHWKTIVLLGDGTWEYIGKIVNQKMETTVMSYNPETGRLEPRQIKQWWKYERKSDLLEISASRNNSTRRGRTICCTPQHMIATRKGYRRADSLEVGDKVLVRGRFFTDFQCQVVLGALIGDAHLQGLDKNRHKSYQLAFTQGEDQKGYLDFKISLFPGLFTSEPHPSPSGYSDKKVWRATMNLVDEFDDLVPIITKDGKINPTSEYMDMLGDIGLAIFYMDNGSININKTECAYVCLHTERFDLGTQQIMADWLQKKFSGKVKLQRSKGHYFIRLNKEASANLLDAVEPYIPACMKYKHRNPELATFNPVPEPMIDVGEVPIRSIKKWDKEDSYSKYVYDIGVEGLHNYVAGNVIVHNSMCDLELSCSLFKAIPEDIQTVLIGDIDQLPSVGPGSVLRDTIISGVLPVTRLKFVYRQGKQSTIAWLADKIRLGEKVNLAELSQKVDDFDFIAAEDPSDAAYAIEDLVGKLTASGLGAMDFQVLTPLKSKGAAGADYLNKMIQRSINPADPSRQELVRGTMTYRLGDKVMVIRNNYQKGVFNGDLGTVTGIDRGGIWAQIDGRPVFFAPDDLGQITLAYAYTIHKSQGGEFPLAIVVCLRSHYIMLQRNLVYTAITRARQRLVIVGQQSAWDVAIRNNRIQQRNSLLAERLKGAV